MIKWLWKDVFIKIDVQITSYDAYEKDIAILQVKKT